MDINALLEVAKKHREDFNIHQKMFDIYEGNLSGHLDNFISRELSPQAARLAKWRKSPINIQKKIVDKLSTIYQQPVNRTIADGTTTDESLLEYYEEGMQMSKVLNTSNEFFNLSRSTLIQPYAHQGKPRLRAVPNDRFFVYSDDQVDPLNVTNVVIATDEIEVDNTSVQIFHGYSDQEFVIFDSRGEIRRDLMNQAENPEGINPYGKIPFVYVNRSSNLIMPSADKDFYHMTLLIPALLTDLNFASMFTLFSIMYGIDLDEESLEMSPNAFWKFKSDPATDKTPSVGTIKNEADVEQVLELVRSQLAFWLETRSIKAGSMGDMDASSFASGISKLIDESDTSDDKKNQIVHFRDAEVKLWDLIQTNLHPVWSANGEVDNKLQFSKTSKVEVDFVDPVPLFRRGQMVNDLKMEVEAGFLTKKRAIAKLNPDKSDDWVEELANEIEEEKMLRMEGFRFGTTESEDSDPEGV